MLVSNVFLYMSCCTIVTPFGADAEIIQDNLFHSIAADIMISTALVYII